MTGLYNKELAFLFVHVPKCGGTSITKALQEKTPSKIFAEIPSIEVAMRHGNRPTTDEVYVVGHARAIDARNGLGESEFNRLLSFGVVRNPWNLMRSRYHYARAVFRQPHRALLDRPFSDFVKWACLNHPVRLCARLADHEGKLVVNRVLRFETLVDDFTSLTTELFGESVQLPFENASVNRDDDPYSDEAIDLMRRTFATDFSLFNYADLPE